MSRPSNPEDIFTSQDPSGEFGRDEGLVGYKIWAGPGADTDKPVPELAEDAIRIAMMVTSRFDVDVKRAVKATIKELDREAGHEVG